MFMYVFLVGLVALMLFGMYQVLETRTVGDLLLLTYNRVSVLKIKSLSKVWQTIQILVVCHCCRRNEFQSKLRRAPVG